MRERLRLPCRLPRSPALSRIRPPEEERHVGDCTHFLSEERKAAETTNEGDPWRYRSGQRKRSYEDEKL